jgi:DNA-binding beta-propeller fold protein YncE
MLQTSRTIAGDNDGRCHHTVVGSGAWGNHDCSGGSYSGDGGPATSATLNCPQGVTIDSSGNIYVADSDNGSVAVLTTAVGLLASVLPALRAARVDPMKTLRDE